MKRFALILTLALGGGVVACESSTGPCLLASQRFDALTVPDGAVRPAEIDALMESRPGTSCRRDGVNEDGTESWWCWSCSGHEGV